MARDLQALFATGAMGTLTDGQLLDRFVERREQVVFEVIVSRHGPMVWGVCRRVLGDHHDTEDAFQATFLVLARRAASIMPRGKLGNWLYGVAYQTALKARAIRTKRRRREGQMPEIAKPMATTKGFQDGLTELLDGELSRLPEKFRIPIVMCELEGWTRQEAADQLGWRIGTVSSRLSRGKSMLARRLSRRGASASVGSLAVLIAQDSASAGMPPVLLDSTAQAACLFVASGTLMAEVVSAEVAALTREVLKIMSLSKLKITTVVVLIAVTLTVGGTSVAYQVRVVRSGSSGSTPVQPLPVGTSTVDSGLPGKKNNVFGGGPNEPRYSRSGDLFFVTSPRSDKFSIYSAATNKASSIRLPDSVETPFHVNAVIGGGSLISLTSSGPKLSKLYVFSLPDWKWYPQDLKEPVTTGTLHPSLGYSVAGYSQGRTIYAFSAVTKRWTVLELPETAPLKPGLSVGTSSMHVEFDSHIYEFTAKSGEWKHTDLRAVIDAAIKAAGDDDK